MAESYWVRNGWQAFSSAGDAQSIALGGRHVTATAATAHLGNPALSGRDSDKRISYSHQNRFAGMINNDLLAMNLPSANRFPIGIGIIHEGVKRIPNTADRLLDWGKDGIAGTGDTGENNGVLDEGERLNEENLAYFNQHQYAFYISTARIWRHYSIGFAFKGLHHKLGNDLGNGFGIQAGIFRNMWAGARFGLVIHDVLSSWMIWESGTVERTAPSLQIGLSQAFYHIFPAVSFDFYCDALVTNNQQAKKQVQIAGSAVYLSYGAEISVKDKMRLRFGRDIVGLLSAGIGLRWENFEIDYAYRLEPQDSQLGPSHYLTFTVELAWLKQIGSSF